MSGAHALVDRPSRNPGEFHDVVQMTAKLGEFEGEAGLRKELHQLYSQLLDDNPYLVIVTIPTHCLQTLVNAYCNVFFLNKDYKECYKYGDARRASLYLQDSFGDARTSFKCSTVDDLGTIVFMRREAGDEARLAAKFKQVLAATEGDEKNRRLLSQFLEGEPAAVVARLEKAAAAEVGEREPEPRPVQEVGQSIKTAATETTSSKNPKRTRKPRQPLPHLKAVKARVKEVKLRSTYDEMKNINLDDPALSHQERIGWARSIKSTYDILRRGDYGFQLPQSLVRKAFAIVKREERHQPG